jgi:drug/metabolite transporter (DMT)-like permease
MLAGMAFFALEDFFLKMSAGGLPPGQVLAMMGAGGAVFFWGVAWRQGHSVLSRRAFAWPAMIRNVTEATGSMAYILALALLPLSVNGAILQASPLVVTLGAALFLGERVGWRRWSAILVGLAGVLLILRPGTESFQWAGLLTVLVVVLIAGRDLATRVVPPDIGTMQLTTWAYLSITLAGLLLMALMGDSWAWPDRTLWAYLGGALLTGIAGYYGVTASMRLGEVSVVAPFRYTRLVLSLLIGVLLLGERPDALMLAGAALVVASGLFTFWREARRKREAPFPADSLRAIEPANR